MFVSTVLYNFPCYKDKSRSVNNRCWSDIKTPWDMLFYHHYEFHIETWDKRANFLIWSKWKLKTKIMCLLFGEFYFSFSTSFYHLHLLFRKQQNRIYVVNMTGKNSVLVQNHWLKWTSACLCLCQTWSNSYDMLKTLFSFYLTHMHISWKDV